MQWGRGTGAAACLAAVVITGSACASTVTGTPRAQEPAASSSAGAPSRMPDATAGTVPVSAPTCADIEPAVAGVLRDYRLDRSPLLPGSDVMTMCFFEKNGGTGAGTVSVSLTQSHQTTDQLNRTRDYLKATRPDQLVDSPAATRLGGYLSEPLGDGNLALVLPEIQVALIAGGGAGPGRQQVVDTLIAIGTALTR
ncbi:hypothetical protein [Prescottella sp. R16]|uniref:hypothetical protein n=1 Tax=Prescottella sp. R16 TaxID=3064529 RepID=UPI00272E92B6|nr:hypothetical protein [Prescottella sp. R16]